MPIGEQFIHSLYPELHTSEPVKRTVQKFKNRGEIISLKPADKLSNWYRDLHQTHMMHDHDSIAFNRLRESYHRKYIVKSEEIPESFFETQVRIARQLGHGDIKLTPEHRDLLKRLAINDQKQSLDNWFEYFTSQDTSMYPMWAKHWAFNGMVKLGAPNASGEFNKRDKGTAAPFPDLNREALALVMDLIIKKAEKKNIPELNDNEELQKILNTNSFGKLYTYALKKIKQAANDTTNGNNSNGSWVKYLKGSDSKPLVEALRGHGTGWCTAGEEVARRQLNAGDFYVYFSNNAAGVANRPRVAIRMQGTSIAEVRGIGANQAMEDSMVEIAEQKLKEFPDGELYKQKVSDMKHLTEIEAKLSLNQKLDLEEARFLFELDKDIIGFGYKKDPRIKNLQNKFFTIDHGDIANNFVIAIHNPRLSTVDRERLISENLNPSDISREKNMILKALGNLKLDSLRHSIVSSTVSHYEVQTKAGQTISLNQDLIDFLIMIPPEDRWKFNIASAPIDDPITQNFLTAKQINNECKIAFINKLGTIIANSSTLETIFSDPNTSAPLLLALSWRIDPAEISNDKCLRLKNLNNRIQPLGNYDARPFVEVKSSIINSTITHYEAQAVAGQAISLNENLVSLLTFLAPQDQLKFNIASQSIEDPITIQFLTQRGISNECKAAFIHKLDIIPANSATLEKLFSDTNTSASILLALSKKIDPAEISAAKCLRLKNLNDRIKPLGNYDARPFVEVKSSIINSTITHYEAQVVAGQAISLNENLVSLLTFLAPQDQLKFNIASQSIEDPITIQFLTQRGISNECKATFIHKLDIIPANSATLEKLFSDTNTSASILLALSKKIDPAEISAAKCLRLKNLNDRIQPLGNYDARPFVEVESSIINSTITYYETQAAAGQTIALNQDLISFLTWLKPEGQLKFNIATQSIEDPITIQFLTQSGISNECKAAFIHKLDIIPANSATLEKLFSDTNTSASILLALSKKIDPAEISAAKCLRLKNLNDRIQPLGNYDARPFVEVKSSIINSTITHYEAQAVAGQAISLNKNLVSLLTFLAPQDQLKFKIASQSIEDPITIQFLTNQYINDTCKITFIQKIETIKNTNTIQQLLQSNQISNAVKLSIKTKISTSAAA